MDGTDRLWTPWRMQYVGNGTGEDGCVFCTRQQASDDVSSLILHRSTHAFIIMNLFPYNTAHCMIVPNRHVDSYESMAPEALADAAQLLPPLLRALRRVLRPAGFNVGTNIGAVSGAGIAEHLHQHVIPRWLGDANFMPIIAGTMVLPELIPVTYAKVRAELSRELDGHQEIAIVAGRADGTVLLRDDGEKLHLPRICAAAEDAVWRTALGGLPAEVRPEGVVGWAGGQNCGGESLAALAVRISEGSVIPAGWRLLEAKSGIAALPEEERMVAERGVAILRSESVIAPGGEPLGATGL